MGMKGRNGPSMPPPNPDSKLNQFAPKWASLVGPLGQDQQGIGTKSK